MSGAGSPGTIVTLLTDFGEGSYVASVKGVILTLARSAAVVDITHAVPPGAVGSAGFLLRHAADCFPAGTVHVCVVDPGVGTDRLPLVVEAGGSTFVGPDNGVFHEAIRARGAARAHRIASGPWLPDKVCATFHGRDLFAPVAGRIAAGDRPDSFGPAIDTGSLVPSPVPPPERTTGRIVGRVVWVDNFGNLVSNVEKADVERWSAGRPVRVRIGRQVVERPIHAFGEVDAGTLAWLYGSWETLEVVASGGSAAETIGASAGEVIVLEIADER